MKIKIHHFILFAFTILLLTNCKKDKLPEPSTPSTPWIGSLKIKFENIVGSNPLVIDTQKYITANGDTFTVSNYKYYISNIKLTKSDGTIYSEPDSYHLINQLSPASLLLTLSNVPSGSYTAINFVIGVDSLRNVSGVQSGELDPAKGMFWTWNSGYIMAKLEGTSPQSGSAFKDLAFHIGGFSGKNNVLKTVSPSFNSLTANVLSTVTPQITITSDILQWFTNPVTINFATTYDVSMAGANAKTIADNYADMFSVKDITN